MKAHIIDGRLRVLSPESLRDAMDKAGHTGAALADECGVTRQAVSQWINGAASPGPAHMVRILNKYGPGVFMVVQ